MKNVQLFTLLILIMNLSACHDPDKNNKGLTSENFESGSFGYDLEFLKNKDSVFVLKNKSGKGQIIISPKYQAKVFTSTANGIEGRSFGWVNYKAFETGKDPHMNAYGGENRIWLGPEGGKFSVFFAPGTAMVFDNWVTPSPIDTEPWVVISHDRNSVLLQKKASFLNYSGTSLATAIERDIKILENADIENLLDIDLNEAIQAVGFKTLNAITNTGKNTWNEKTGAPCIWILDMFNVSPATVIVIPYKEEGNSKIATTDYFGEIPEDRIAYKNGVLLFKADGNSRGKLGIGPERAKPIAGSYDAIHNVLTIVTFDVDKDAIYLNQEWTTEKDPLNGDAVNAYNDGPLEEGSQMGPFYEIESVSPAAFLKSGETLTHQHNVFHFIGDKKRINEISKKLLGITLAEIESTFK